ncbi:MAG: DUF4292 domain-containing protein [Bacteroidia bacterium]|nr:DUF4292 domain-containing protein [Bacteroidia bacterium]
MSKYLLLRIAAGVVLLCGLGACKTRQKASPVPPADGKPVQEASVQELLSRLDSSAFHAGWINAKASVTTIQEGNETSFNITMRARKDSIIWISISPLLGIEVARVLITPDSVKFLDRLHNKYQVNTFETINKLLQLKVNFEIVQSLMFGNFFAYKKNENRFNSVYLEDKYYILSSLNKKKLKRALEEKDPNKPVIQDVFINNTYFRIFRMSVDDQKIGKSLVTEYEDFRQTDYGQFPFKSNTRITADKDFEIKIEFGKLVTGEEQEFPFNIPSSYERVR